jgi:hypothetical protein
MKSRVYFIHCIGTQFCKIGVAINVNKRLANLQCANPHELRVLATRPGDRDLEMTLHTYFRYKRVRGEWFRFRSPERAAYLFQRYSITQLWEEIQRQNNESIDRERERSMRSFTPDERVLFERFVRNVSGKMSAGNVRA